VRHTARGNNDSECVVGHPYLIWSDPVKGYESVGSFLLLFEDRASSSRGRFERRLISLIFAGRNSIILIRRELPLTYVASPRMGKRPSMRFDLTSRA
jgi:hypothetical protein